MAYSSVVTSKRVGPGLFEITIEETDCGPTSEAVIAQVPVTGLIRRQTCVLGAGTGTTVFPILGTETNPSGINIVVENDAPAAVIDVQGAATYVTDTGLLYHRSQPDSGNDNVVTTTYHISTNW